MNSSDLYQAIKEGHCIAYPTETVWGLGCDPSNEKAIREIYAIKERDPSKASLVLVNSIDMIGLFVNFSKLEEKALLATEPTTVIIDEVKAFSNSIKGPNQSLGFRICSFPPIQELIAKLGHPLVSTSANISGQKAATRRNELNPKVINSVKACADFNNPTPSNKSSRIVKIEAGQTIVIRA